MTARYSCPRLCTCTSTVSQLLNTFKSASVRPVCCDNSPRPRLNPSVREIQSDLRPSLLWIWRRYRLRAARGSQRNPCVIHGHAAGGCCCGSLQIAAHLVEPTRAGWWRLYYDHSLSKQRSYNLWLFCVLGIKSSVEQPLHRHYSHTQELMQLSQMHEQTCKTIQMVYLREEKKRKKKAKEKERVNTHHKNIYSVIIS